MPNRKPTSNESKRFEEERARRILRLCFPEKYAHALLSESPDIVDVESGIGVEVTDSMLSYFHEGFARASEVTGKAKNELNERNKANIANGKITAHELPNGKMLAAFAAWGEPHDICQSYIKKTKRLNTHIFKKYRENNLFIYAWMIDSDDLESNVDHLLNNVIDDSAKENSCIHFDRVYIFTEPCLIEIIMEQRKVNTYPIGTAQLDRISNDTFIEIIGISREEFYRK